MRKKIVLGILSLLLLFHTSNIAEAANHMCDKKKGTADYSYTITPLLEPFNEYFYVQTDNPDPTSFRFADKSSVYDKASSISLDYDDWNKKIKLYADVKYENVQTGRVNGGYIFRSSDTDGGEIILQSKNQTTHGSSETWSDTKVKLRLPVLKDDVDYLIDTYAVRSSFFDNMDAVQDGFSSICLYSGSNVRGTLEKTDDYWFVARAAHREQKFYIYSPYERKDSKRLFASAIYPYRCDSLGFPSMMGKIAKRLDSSASYVWNRESHAHIDVTYGGETHRYGGQGNGEGKGINEDQIITYFTLGQSDIPFSIDGMKQLLMEYSQIETSDDIPRDDALTWKDIYDTVGTGEWVKISGTCSKIGDKWDLSSSMYTYFYPLGDGTRFWNEEWGIGYGDYLGGDLGYACDTWVDGRYVDQGKAYVPGERFEAHPTSDILLTNVMLPQIVYQHNRSGQDNDLQITEKQKTVLFSYSADKNIWIAIPRSFDKGCMDYQQMLYSVENGSLDASYLDQVTLTTDEVKSLVVDKNTDLLPDDYLIYDGTARPGTRLKDHQHNYTSAITEQPTCTEAGIKTNTCAICGNTFTEAISAAGHVKVTDRAVKPNLKKNGKTAGAHCSVCGKVLKAQKTIAKLRDISKVKVKGLSAKYCTGKTIKPSVKVYYGKVLLKKGIDYTVGYGTNRSAGKGTVSILGKGKYGGKVTKTFSILPAKS